MYIYMVGTGTRYIYKHRFILLFFHTHVGIFVRIDREKGPACEGTFRNCGTLFF